MVLTNRDLKLFKLISMTAILSTEQIQNRVFKNIAKVTVLRRLRKLERGKYISKVLGLPSFEAAWHLTLKGAEVIGAENVKRNFHPLNLVHDTKLSGVRFILEDQGVSRSWIPEHEIRSKMARKHGLRRMISQSVPDGIMSIKNKGAMESVAIELELHYKNKDRYKQIFNSYSQKRNIFAVWYLVLTKPHGRHLEKIWKDVTGYYEGPLLLWSEVSEVEKNGARARLYFRDKTYLVEDVFIPETLEVAQEAGSDLSREMKKNIEVKSDLTERKEKEILAEAG